MSLSLVSYDLFPDSNPLLGTSKFLVSEFKWNRIVRVYGRQAYQGANSCFLSEVLGCQNGNWAGTTVSSSYENLNKLFCFLSTSLK